jgi:hypothetical protein
MAQISLPYSARIANAGKKIKFLSPGTNTLVQSNLGTAAGCLAPGPEGGTLFFMPRTARIVPGAPGYPITLPSVPIAVNRSLSVDDDRRGCLGMSVQAAGPQCVADRP